MSNQQETKPVTQVFQVWSEGYRATGDYGVAISHGQVEAENFRAACDQIFGSNLNYNSERLTYWGCRLFDSELEARKSFG
jgi:hypothetical protein